MSHLIQKILDSDGNLIGTNLNCSTIQYANAFQCEEHSGHIHIGLKTNANIDISKLQLNRIISNKITAYTGNARIPLDNTIPLVTEGAQIWSHTLTPLDLDSVLVINQTFMVKCSSNNRHMVCSFFKNNTCVGVNVVRVDSSSFIYTMPMIVVDTPNSTEPVTYSARIGCDSSTTWYINGAIGQYFNGLLDKNGYVITEYL